MILTEKELGNRLRELRLEAGLSQEDVARALCYSRSAYSCMERGITKLTADILQKLAVLYQQPIEAFFRKPIANQTKGMMRNGSKSEKGN